MRLSEFVLLIGIAVIGYMLFSIALSYISIYRHAKIVRRNKTQMEFVRIQHDMMMLILKGRLDPTLRTFQRLYYLNKLVYSNPQFYDYFSRGLAGSRSNGDLESADERRIWEDIENEKHRWGDDFKNVILREANALQDLIVSHSAWLRFVVPIALKVYPPQGKKKKKKQSIAAAEVTVVKKVAMHQDDKKVADFVGRLAAVATTR